MTGYGGNQTRRRKTRAFDNRVEIDDALPEVRLIVALITRAGLDVLNGDPMARRYVLGPDFADWCEWINVDAARLRDRLISHSFKVNQ